MPKLTLVEKAVGYAIERAEHEKRWWDEPTDHGAMAFYSGWISDAAIAGSADEMLEIAAAIRRRGQESFKRCAVVVSYDLVRFWSPRNSTKDGVCTLAEADALADVIEAKLAG